MEHQTPRLLGGMHAGRGTRQGAPSFLLVTLGIDGRGARGVTSAGNQRPRRLRLRGLAAPPQPQAVSPSMTCAALPELRVPASPRPLCALPASPPLMAPVTSPPRTWWGWGRGQDRGTSPACLSPERIQGRLQGAPLSTEGKAEATEPEAALAGAAPAPSHPPLPGHDTRRQPCPELGREAPSRTHQLCTEGAAETPRVGAQPGAVEQGPQADGTGTHSHDSVLRHRAAGRPPRAATALPGRRGPSFSFTAAPSLSACCPVRTPPRVEKGKGGSRGSPLGLSPAPASPLPRSGSPWAHLAVCDSPLSPILSDTLWIRLFLPLD